MGILQEDVKHNYIVLPPVTAGEGQELGDEELEAVRRAFLVEPESTLYGTINALTRAGNDPVLSVESREKCQEVGGRILELASKGTRWLD